MLGPALALFSAVASGVSVVWVRKHSAESNVFNISLIISLVGMGILWPLAVVLTDFSAFSLGGLALFALGGVLTPGLVRLLYYSGMDRLGAPVNSSVFSVYPLYSSILAVLFLSEVLFFGNWVGILLVFLGGIFVELSFREISRADRPSRKNLVFPILGGLTLGVSSILRKYALDLYNAPLLGVAVAYTFSFLPYILVLVRSAPTRKAISLKRDGRLFWTAGVGQALSWVLSFYALSYAEVSIITPLLSVEPLFVALFAYLYLKEVERISPKLIVSIILTVLGVALVTTRL